MRILLANTGHPATIKGGAEAAVLDLAHLLVKRGHDVALVVHHAGPHLEETLDGGVRVYALPNRNLYFGFDGGSRPAPTRLAWHALDAANPFMASAFGRILDRERPEVVNTHVVAGLSQLVWREAATRRIPLVHYLHEYGTMCPRGSAFRDGCLCAQACGICRILTAPRKRLSRLVDTVIGVSRFTLERHLSWGFFPHAETRVLPNVFADLHVHLRPKPNAGPLRLGYFGRLIPDKGAHLLLEALASLGGDGWTLDVAGDGDADYIAKLKAASPANVRFLGWTSADALFGNIDALVVPSIWPDPQPRVIFESFARGIPVIGSNAGGIPEQIDEGTTGWLFEAGSARDLGRTLEDIVVNRRDLALSSESFTGRLDRLRPDIVVADYEGAYRAAIIRKNAPATDMKPGKSPEPAPDTASRV